MSTNKKPRDCITIDVIRRRGYSLVKIWIDPAIEQAFKNIAEDANAPVMESSKWKDEAGNGLHFYKIPNEIDARLLKGGYYNDYGKPLVDPSGNANVALLRTVGISQKGGISVKTTDMFAIEDCRLFTEKTAEWAKRFYKNYIEDATYSAKITLEE